MSTDLETIRLDVADGVATIRLSRPDRLNAWTPRMGVELFGAIHRLDRDDAVRAIVVTGEGRAFCAGADLAAGGDTFAGEGTWATHAEVERRTQPWNMRTPVIAAINGPAVGVGATVPLSWDIRLASDRAKIGFVFTRRGLVPEANSTWLLPRLVGTSRALEILLSGRLLTADEALAYGLVSRVVPHDLLMQEAHALARDIATNAAPVSVAITKRLVWRHLLEPDPRAAKQREDACFHWSGKQPDAAEGITAFLEKREPRWTMPKTTDLPVDLGDEFE